MLYKKIRLIFTGIVLFSLISFMVYDFFKTKKNLKKLSFNGVVDSITLDRKGFKSIYFDTTCIYLGQYGNYVDISIGDSLIKKKDTYFFLIFKKDTTGAYYLFQKEYME